MEKSLLSFATTYPGWQPGAAAKQLLGALRPPPPPPPACPGQPPATDTAQWRDGVMAYQPHYPFTNHLSDSLINGGEQSTTCNLARGPPTAPGGWHTGSRQFRCFWHPLSII